jgi:hypothetical protein
MSAANAGPSRELTWDERATWGRCPVCLAQHGTYCHADFGIQLGRHADGTELQDGEGVHLARIRLAPERVREVPA